MSPRILLTISRSWTRWSEVRRVLTDIHGRWPDAVLVHGDAYKGDRQAAGIWKDLGGREERWPAKWWLPCVPDCDHPPRRRNGRHYCPAQGPKRNAAMVESNPDMVVAFIRDGSAGASGTADLAEGAGIPIDRYVHEEES